MQPGRHRHSSRRVPIRRRAMPPSASPSIPPCEMLLCCCPASWISSPLSNRLPKNPRYMFRFSVPVTTSVRVFAVVRSTRHSRMCTRSSPAARSTFTSSSDQSGTIARSWMPPLRGFRASSSTPSRYKRTPFGIAVVRGDLRSENESGRHQRHAGHGLEQIAERQRAGRKKLIAVPMPVARADFGRARRVWTRDRRFDRVARRLPGNGVGRRRDGSLGAVHAVGDGRALGRICARRVRAGRRDLRTENGKWRAHGHDAAEQQRVRDFFSRQRTRPRTNSTNVRTGTPVGPRGIEIKSVSEYAVPAMSRCAHL